MKESILKILDELIERYPILSGQRENIIGVYRILEKRYYKAIES